MFNIKKQKNKIGKIVYPKKYRLTIFGYTPHFDWKVLIGLFLLMIIFVASYATFIKLEIDSFIDRDFSEDVELEKNEDIDIERYQRVLDDVENI
ncbi:hypothetical protein GW764_03375 [Candidatus Parcubacteria bacterium]|nr:hypothetical protein [Candidatus Parcubacteria bacterium]